MTQGMATILDVTPAHLTREDVELFHRIHENTHVLIGVTVYTYGEGVMVVTEGLATGTPEERALKVQAIKDEGFSNELIAILTYCAENGGIMARFDSASSLELDDFPIFDHETGLEITAARLRM